MNFVMALLYSASIPNMKYKSWLVVEFTELSLQEKTKSLISLWPSKRFLNFSITLETHAECWDKSKSYVFFALFLEFLNHKNIIALQGIMTIDNLSTFNEIYLIMEFMEFDLRRLIQSQMKITEQMIKFIMYQLLVSINFMHSADILHRDIKP